MLAQVRSATVVGLDAVAVDVEVDVSPGIPTFAVVGLPDTAVREARERVWAASSPAVSRGGSTRPLTRAPSARAA